ncbi:MAG: hypothetical protein COA33_003970 [Fluviicola sp.]|nr:hypothetical protein [Fluviicola sp.]
MVLVGFNFWDVIVGMLWVTLIILLAFIGYRWLLRRLSKGNVNTADYCTLYNIEENPASGEIPFYFTSNEEKEFTLSVLDAEMNDFMEVATGKCSIGGNIIRFDSSKIPNGDYFYSLKTKNQKAVKKMQILNS